MADQRDNTNSGIAFPPHQDQVLMAQGKLNIGGKESRVIVVLEKVSKDKEPVRVLYEKVGVLFDNDKKGNDKAPDYSGPLENHPNLRIAAWKGEKDGKRYLSLKASEKSGGNGGSGPADESNGWGDSKPKTQAKNPVDQGYGGIDEDQIPF